MAFPEIIGSAVRRMASIDDKLLDQYTYATDDTLRAHLHAQDRARIASMLAYTRGISSFGMQMTAHQNRVAKDGARFLKHLGYSDRAARNYRAALLFHDMGKTHESYDPRTWGKADRPTPEEKAHMRKHARLGADMLMDMAQAQPALHNHPHILMRHAVTLYHHERVDGTGPEALDISTLPVFVQASCIVDAYDGDMIARPHQTHQRTPREALRRLMALDDTESKYAGAFNKDLLKEYVTMKETQFPL